MSNVGADGTAEGSVISLPKGGGAISGLGEKFSPDLFTGTGNFSVPIAVPPGRRGLQPQLALTYSTGNANGPFGLGWQLSVPGVSRKTSRGIPRYADAAGHGPDGLRADVFVLSGAEDLVPVAGSYPGRVRYRPRTEGLFAWIEHVRDTSGNYWEVRGKDGLLTRYGTPRPDGTDAAWRDPAAVADPADPGRVFGWRVTRTQDPLGNLIQYAYLPDQGLEPAHRWNHPLPARIAYADYGDRAAPSFLVEVDFEYETRPDPFSDYRPGFELRTSLRCRTIRVTTHAADGIARVAREYRFSYQEARFNGASLLNRVDVVGVDDQDLPPGQDPALEHLPPLTFGYSGFDPDRRRFEAVSGPGLPAGVLTDPAVALVDVSGAGLPDVVEFGTAERVWRNAGGGRFELPRQLADAPPFSLADPGVQLMDADGDGRPDLIVPTVSAGGQTAGYFPMRFAGGWSRRSFQPYRLSPPVGLADPGVKLIDLDGDGLTDVLRSGTRLECWFNDRDPRRAWQRTAVGNGTAPAVDLADPRVRLADMTGDGLHDLVLLRNGNIAYWPNLGYGRWGAQVTMRRSPRLPEGYDPRRVLLGDVDGDGTADLIYVDDGRVLLWGNRSGNAWTEQPVIISGTPGVVSTDAVQLSDLHGTGMAGLLVSRPAGGSGRPYLRFLDFSGGVKPHLLEVMDNHLGATTRVTYAPSTREYLRDQRDPATRWRTTLPFPVHVVSRVEVIDAVSGGRLTSRYRYHHGYWDGVEREFRGFAMVEHLDTEAFDPAAGPDPMRYSPPTLTKSWFHPGPVAATEAGDWSELDLRHEYWDGDPPMLLRPAGQAAFLAGLPRQARRAALRAMRGQVLRTELYALDGTGREHRPYTVTETIGGVREESPADRPGNVRERIFFPFTLGSRATQHERGDEPMTQFTFPAGYDTYGFPAGQLAVAVPRGRDPMTAAAASEPYLGTYATTEYARRDDTGHYLADRVARTTSYEVVNDGRLPVADLRDAVFAGPAAGAGVSLRVIGHSRTYYDGDAFTGLPLGMLGEYGLPVRAESLAFTDSFLDALFVPGDPLTTGPRPVFLTPDGVAGWPAEYPQEFRDLLPSLAGYVHYRDGDVPGSTGGYYVTTARHRYDAQVPGRVPRGLPLASLDPLGAQDQIDYDQHDLLPVRTTDAAGLATAADNDYRVLRPRAVTDVNGNTASVRFSPAGLVTAQYVRGKNGEGDQAAAGAQMTYDLHAFTERGQPVSARTIRRVHHDTDTGVLAGQLDDVIVSVEYSDGFGRALQTRTQAEDTLFGDRAFGGGVIPIGDLAPTGDTTGRTRAPSDPDNVIVSGWQVYDNKGRVVHKYEPFFSAGYDYAPPLDTQLGQHVTTFYDPRGQAVRTVNPDGSEQRVIFGIPADLAVPEVFAPTPWESYTYDANDNAGRTHGDTAAAYRAHWDTPASTEIDALGRTVGAVARNGATDADWFTTRSAYDIMGNLVSITDALGREAFRYTFDLGKRRWRMDSIDAGRRDDVPDALGRPVQSRDSKSALTLQAFDPLRLPTRVWARDDATAPVTLRQLLEYGDGGIPGQPATDRDAARALNLLGRLVHHYDEAGLVTVAAADFKGNVLESTRTVIADAPILDTYQQAVSNGWQVVPFQIQWAPGPGQTRAVRDAELLEPDAYITTTSYDALNRMVTHVLPADVEGHRRELRPAYNRAGALDQIRLDDTVYVQRITYDAKGQRTLVAYGNGVMTRYAYDPRTFRLARLRTEHYTLTDGFTYRPSGNILQDYGYDYDLAGNILTIRDRTPRSGIPGNPQALGTIDPQLRQIIGSGDALDRQFTHDPLYRLLTATGREHQAPPPGDPWTDTPRGTDITRAQPYTETYAYDPAGNILTLTHRSTGGFTRAFTIAASSNRLQQMTARNTPYDYTYDANGNLTAETTSRHFAWNHADQLKAFATQTQGAQPSLHAQYLYDAAGQRVKKLVRRQGGAVEVTHYLGQVFEHHRWPGPAAGQNNHLHVMDDHQRVALVRAGAAHPDDRGPATAFQLGDHLGSSDVVADETGTLTNREEYTPHGETSFGSYSRKRYRFTGQERDEESSLSYHSARYYAPWLARWVSADPLGSAAGSHLYRYASGNPVRNVDRDGQDDEEAWHGEVKAKVWEAALVDEPVIVSGESAGQVSVGKFGAGLNLTDRSVEGTFSVVNVEVSPKLAGELYFQASAKVLEAEVSFSLKEGVGAGAALYEAGVGAKVGPAGGKVLFGLSAGISFKSGNFKVKLVGGVGGEIEVDLGSIMQPMMSPADLLLAIYPATNPNPAYVEEPGMHAAGFTHETAPPVPKPRHGTHHRSVLPEPPRVHGCAFGPGDPEPHERVRRFLSGRLLLLALRNDYRSDWNSHEERASAARHPAVGDRRFAARPSSGRRAGHDHGGNRPRHSLGMEHPQPGLWLAALRQLCRQDPDQRRRCPGSGRRIGNDMSTLVFEIFSPQADAEVPRTFSVLASQQRDAPTDFFPFFRIDSVQLQFGPGGSTIDAATTSPRQWTGTGTLPPGTKGGDTVTLTATAQVVQLDVNGGQTGPFPVSRTATVRAETTFPQVTIDAFDRDVASRTLPHKLTLTGTAVDAQSGVDAVSVRVDGGAAVAARNDSGDWGHWAIDLDLPAGQHTLRVDASDGLGNTGSAQDSIVVKAAPEPTPHEQAFAATAYLKALLGNASRYLRLGAGTSGPSVADLAARLGQPLDRLTRAAEFGHAVAGVSQARVAVEVLRGQLQPPAPAGLDQRYRAHAYEVLLRVLGTSGDELRLARVAAPAGRQALAARLGLELSDPRPDRLDAITLDPDMVTDAQLERLFGYKSTTPADPLAPPPAAALGLWRTDALRSAWRRADEADRDGTTAAAPIIDPDVLPRDYLLGSDDTNIGHQIWAGRRAAVDADVTAVATRLGAAFGDQPGYDAALADLGLDVDLVALAAQEQAGVDVTAQLAAADLDPAAYRFLLRVRALLAAGPVSAGERADVAAILVRVRTRRRYRQWRQEERQHGLILEPAVFTASTDGAGAIAGPAAGALRWRTDPAALRQWRATLAARIQQAGSVAAALAAAVLAAEAEALPALRDALIGELGDRHTPQETPAAAAERLSRRLSIDLRAAAGTRTTRVGQAVGSVGSLISSARAGQLDAGPGEPAATIIDEATFDTEWEWLETYPRWRSAMTAFAYPETRLFPTLYVKEPEPSARTLEPTTAYTGFLTDLAARSALDPATARDLAGNYLIRLDRDDHLAVHVPLTDRQSNAQIDARRRHSDQLAAAATEESQIRQHVREVFWLVPMALARKLQAAGHYRAALDWYQTVFAYQLPPGQRLIYTGLRLEQSTVSTYGRLSEWLSVITELNPHFTARERRGAYTRFTIQSIAECFLAYADSEFAKGAADSNARARAFYQTAADLMALPEAADDTLDDQGNPVPFAPSPVRASLLTRAQLGLEKIHAGLNIAGQASADTTADTSLLPSQYRYSVLIERTKTLVSIGQQVEAAYLAALERADAEQYGLLQARHDLRVAGTQVGIAELQVGQAVTGVLQAGLQVQRAQLQQSTYDGWLRDGLNWWESVSVKSFEAAAYLQTSAGLIAGANAILGALTFGILGDTDSASQAASALAGAASSTGQVAQLKGGFERREQEWTLNRGLAAKDVQLAAVQERSADLQLQIAGHQRGLAAEQQDHAQAVAEFLATKFTNADLFEWMSGVLGQVYAFFLQQATALAQLAQAQLAFERQEPVTGFIAADYWEPSAADTTGSAGADRRGLTGSERLLADVYRLDQHAFDTDRRKLHLTQTISMAEIAGQELQELRETGVLTVAIGQDLFDRDFPGHYLRLIKRVRPSVIALVPPGRGLRATLSASGMSRVVVARGPFETVTLRRDPESIAFTAPVNATGLFELEPEGNLLLPFEGMGVDTIWRLELPKPANPIDYQSIADVLLTIEYSALDSADYRQQVIRRLDRRFTGDRSFSIREQFPDTWYDLNNPDTVDDLARVLAVDLPLTTADFPPNLTELALEQLTLFVVGANGVRQDLTVSAARHAVGAQVTTAGPVTTVGGVVGTRRANGAPWLGFIGSDLAGDWQFTLEDTSATRALFTTGLIRDLMLVFSLSGTTPAWP